MPPPLQSFLSLDRSPPELAQVGEEYLAYSDEHWNFSWDETEEACRFRAMALALAFMARRFFYSKPRLSQRYDKGSRAAHLRAKQHWDMAAEYRELAQEAEISSTIAFQAAEGRQVD